MRLGDVTLGIGQLRLVRAQGVLHDGVLPESPAVGHRLLHVRLVELDVTRRGRRVGQDRGHVALARRGERLQLRHRREIVGERCGRQ